MILSTKSFYLSVCPAVSGSSPVTSASKIVANSMKSVAASTTKEPIAKSNNAIIKAIVGVGDDDENTNYSTPSAAENSNGIYERDPLRSLIINHN